MYCLTITAREDKVIGMCCPLLAGFSTQMENIPFLDWKRHFNTVDVYMLVSLSVIFL